MVPHLQSNLLLSGVKKLVVALLPPFLALAMVFIEPNLTIWVKDKPTVLPIILLMLLACLVHPRTRQMLVISLCWGVCFLAFRDTFRTKQMNFGVPESMYRTEDLKETIVMTAYMTVAGLAALAALGETFSQGSVWTKRCYFGAAALYFTGIGLNSLSGTITWQAIVLSVTGLTAILGCIFTTDIISNEDESDVTGPSDDEQQRENEERHQSALKDKEWHDKIAIT